jgi:hypothetical protein
MKIKCISLFLVFLPTIGLLAENKMKPTSEKDMAAYLMVYFKDDTHSLYFALSSDGYS